jgi:hypothetical protein
MNALPFSKTDKCDVPKCPKTWAVVFGNVLGPTIIEAVFGDDPGEIIKACQHHYNYLKRSDGITLGYRKINGKTMAYVKDASF